ncbi:phosphotransferase [Anabaena cylindrica FACHB-243]|uniref:Aminoglycoside phosphotransferase n=1 Tax=Anabaena cylindrica (strain ATCC 27899 / PCC 7122) TaxID=272123 RepID=K9ZMB1_ANACC|nr:MULTISPECIES: aminoglycoside phosphotransferase family protein [Anabaena]AFZ59465.1 aminoglycoside phosphotransferase [Anabaena cylindrica PCC 7122]MBD2417620.1 phosphotransferase [Anabaena cylindrica FACHB-243]MBY5283188.1 aminoglycoside phosphotransferase family protein [Anabaena sp. CCAP 1446/1C]MBY5308631.1 aminoglycoside phosphotransferase family protein [Anabaena sp. CCAP 1446/1C]MCM2405381.1 aminoglycoside phosphotransferase family protein [Anabaena sp. CCAP 1446/1C]
MAFLLSSQNVSQYLLDMNLCTQQDLESIQIETLPPAKNFNLLIKLPNERKFLVKQECHAFNGRVANELINEWKFYQLQQHLDIFNSLKPSVIPVVNFDEANSIIIYEYLDKYSDLIKVYHQEKVFPSAIAASVGKILATLHRTTFNQPDCQDFLAKFSEEKIHFEFSNPAKNLEKGISRISPEIFGMVPPECLKFFILYQRYNSLAEAVTELKDAWHPCCLTHNDLKLNNILIDRDGERQLRLPKASLSEELDAGMMRLIDWERCAWGDPAFDLGTIIASYLQIWLSSLVVASSIQIEESLRLAETPLELLQSSILALTKAYLRNFPMILEYRPDFLKRVIQFAGLGLIHQIESIMQYQKLFGNTGICMLQVAKTLLCRPEESIYTVFGTVESDLTSPKPVAF